MVSAADVERAAHALAARGVVVYPTETVYGLGVDAASDVALKRLIRLKGREGAKGLSVLVANLDAARALLSEDPPAGARALAAAFWPGPLTLVLSAARAVPPPLLGPTGGIGLRCSTDDVARTLLAHFRGAITSTSANPSGQPPATTIAEARAYFGDRVDCYLDGGPRRGAHASTVVEFLGGSAYLRRVGALDLNVLRVVTRIEPVGD